MGGLRGGLGGWGGSGGEDGWMVNYFSGWVVLYMWEFHFKVISYTCFTVDLSDYLSY